MRGRRRPYLGPKRVGEFTRQPRVAIAIEYLEEAVIEAEAAARWYADRSATAAVGFTAELDAAEAAITRLPNAWPQHDHGTRRYLLRRYPFSVVYRVEPDRILIVAVAHAVDGQATGRNAYEACLTGAGADARPSRSRPPCARARCYRYSRGAAQPHALGRHAVRHDDAS